MTLYPVGRRSQIGRSRSALCAPKCLPKNASTLSLPHSLSRSLARAPPLSPPFSLSPSLPFPLWRTAEDRGTCPPFLTPKPRGALLPSSLPRLSRRRGGSDRSVQLQRNAKRFRGGLVIKAHRLLYHSTLGLRVMNKKRNLRFRV
jgi:hypothetical protein